MRDKDSKKKTVKVMGPWVDGVRSVKEIPLEEWTSYTPLNRRVQGEWFRVVGWWSYSLQKKLYSVSSEGPPPSWDCVSLSDKKKEKKVKLTLDFRVNLWFNIRMLNVIDKLNEKIEKAVDATNEFIDKAVDFLINKIPF